MKKIYKYKTGEEIPKDAVYLNTVAQVKIKNKRSTSWDDCWLVWHYFLVEVKNE